MRNASVPSSAVGVSVLDLADPPELIALFAEPELIGNGIGPVLLGKLIDRARGGRSGALLIESDPNAEPFTGLDMARQWQLFACRPQRGVTCRSCCRFP